MYLSIANLRHHRKLTNRQKQINHKQHLRARSKKLTLQLELTNSLINITLKRNNSGSLLLLDIISRHIKSCHQRSSLQGQRVTYRNQMYFNSSQLRNCKKANPDKRLQLNLHNRPKHHLRVSQHRRNQSKPQQNLQVDLMVYLIRTIYSSNLGTTNSCLKKRNRLETQSSMQKRHSLTPIWVLTVQSKSHSKTSLLSIQNWLLRVFLSEQHPKPLLKSSKFKFLMSQLSPDHNRME